MKTMIAVLLALAVASTAAAEVRVFTGEPDCRYEVLSPVSGRAKSAEKAHKNMLKSAEKLGADAVIHLSFGSYTFGVPTPYNSTLMATWPTVNGIAVKCVVK
jgi:uncharacterized protein YbjQ (UPF0145 family)